MTKDELREKMRAKRRELTQKQAECMSEKIRSNLLSLDCIKNAKNICTFLSAFKEPDTIEIIKLLWEKKCGVIVPVSDTKTNTISLSYINSLSGLKKGAYGILEPSIMQTADNTNIDATLVPGLAFDRGGGRMGFGKGYYDRFLSVSKSVKIGLCYDFQLFDTIPKEKHDVPMDFVITEKEICEIR